MASQFKQLEKRVLLRKKLSESGFEVRMHSYDYYVIKEKFVSIISLEPEFNKASIKKISCNLKGSIPAIDKIYKIVKEIDPKITIEVRE
ncbi:MAG: hypothetical protein QXJ17_07245 [Nitrososphaeria archaeon]